MGDDPCPHTLPIELGYQILQEAWSSPLSRAERRNLLVALPSVCRAFRAIADRMFLRDVHVVSPAYAAHVLSLLHPAAQEHEHDSSSPLCPRPSPTAATCHSITFYIYNNPSSSSSAVFQLYGSSNPTTRAMETILRALKDHGTPDALAPALHRVALHYTGWSFTRELEHTRLLNLPSRVRSLELCFATPSLFSQHLRQSYVRRCALPMPDVRTLTIYGACPAFVVDVARACPALERLETDDVRGVLVLQPSLRPFMLLPADDAAHAEQSEHFGRKKNASEQDEPRVGIPMFQRDPRFAATRPRFSR